MPVPVDLTIPYVEQAEIRVDGRGDEPAWAGAALVPGPFVQFHPTPDTAPTGPTEVRVLADARALYVSARLTDPEPDKVRGAIGRRDTRWSDDFFAMYLDPTGESQRAYLFLVNAAGVLHDGTVTSAAGESESWDGVWSASARRTDQGWEAELAIPWRSIPHPRDIHQVGLLVFRHIARLGEKSSWPALNPDVQGLLLQEAIVTGPGIVPKDPGLDLLPEVTFGWTDRGPVKPLIGAYGVSPGLTVRYRPSPSAALLGTFNPDFSQVESDAAQIGVNRRDALYFEEKRPFFLDGQEWFDHPLGELVYTRTVQAPYGGLRTTLEPPGGTVASLVAVDSAPGPSIAEQGGWTEDELRGHDASVAIVRARGDLGEDGQVGLLLSDRSILGTPLANRLAAVDTRIRLSDTTTATASAAGSYTTFGDGTVGIAPAGSARIEYSDAHPYFGTWANAVGPSFRAENGYFPQTDRIGGGSWAGVNLNPDSEVVPQISITPLSVWYAWQFDGELRNLGAELNSDLSFGNGTHAAFGGYSGVERFAGELLPSRGGWVYYGGTLVRWLEVELNLSGGLSPWY
ncbi:MAG: sugar-binding protein, partial [Myxococcota bacterium]